MTPEKEGLTPEELAEWSAMARAAVDASEDGNEYPDLTASDVANARRVQTLLSEVERLQQENEQQGRDLRNATLALAAVVVTAGGRVRVANRTLVAVERVAWTEDPEQDEVVYEASIAREALGQEEK